VIKLSTSAELSQFLSSVERRAYKHAAFAVRDNHSALDIVQDAMLKLAEKYGDKPVEEFPMLFQRILQNTIRDYYRRQKVRSSWITLFSGLQPKHEEEEFDPLDVLVDSENRTSPLAPDQSLQQSQMIGLIEQAISKLPPRQREAFLLRYWEGLDTTETAAAMGCTEGSVKTHCSRAVKALAVSLKAKGVELP
jgi:RNA polymerase sigma-70 factor (ECF subfamily)